MFIKRIFFGLVLAVACCVHVNSEVVNCNLPYKDAIVGKFKNVPHKNEFIGINNLFIGYNSSFLLQKGPVCFNNSLACPPIAFIPIEGTYSIKKMKSQFIGIVDFKPFQNQKPFKYEIGIKNNNIIVLDNTLAPVDVECSENVNPCFGALDCVVDASVNPSTSQGVCRTPGTENTHCGGNIVNPVTCLSCLHCQLNPTHPDVGGICQK